MCGITGCIVNKELDYKKIEKTLLLMQNRGPDNQSYRLFKFGKKFSFIGNLSYSIYLIHFPLILVTLIILNILDLKINFNSMTIFCTYLVLTLLVSFISYNFLEIPLKKILRKKYIKNDK